jgi:hypothetical protein
LTNYLGSFTKIPILLNPQAAKPIDLHKVLRRGDYLKLESDMATKRGHGA